MRWFMAIIMALFIYWGSSQLIGNFIVATTGAPEAFIVHGVPLILALAVIGVAVGTLPGR